MSTRIPPTLRTGIAAALTLVSLLGLTAAPALAATWTQVATTGPEPRGSLQVAYDSARGRTVLFGGYDGSQVFGDTWEWDGQSWQLVATNGPSPRALFGMSYDSQRQVTVLFGGLDYDSQPCGNTMADTWEWDGNTWTQRFPTTSPPARSDLQMTYDGTRGVTVLYGGLLSSCGTLFDTWEWNGTTWTQVLTANQPSVSHSADLEYDTVNGVSVLFGGYSNGPTGETWLWDGASWIHAISMGPPARYGHDMAYDTDRSRIVLFGGWNDVQNLADTWEWDGSAWTQVAVSGPSPRHSSPMAYHASEGVTILFGGTTGGSEYLGDTWEYTGDPTITLSLDCGGISACPMGTFGYRAIVTNPAQTTLTLRVAIAPGIGVPSPILLLNQPVTGSTEIVHEYTTSDQIPNVCPTQVKVRAALLDTGATVIARDTCRIDFLPLTP